MRLQLIKPMARNLPGDLLRVSLVDRNPDVARAFLEHFHDVDGVEILEGNLLDLECDALLSPANSFGYMDGGFDKHIDDFYQGAAQRAVLSAIAERHFGELPVGVAILLEMPSRRFPSLVVAPTMRIPGAISETLNAYLALRAAFIAIEERNSAGGRRIGSLAVPGLGTGVGGMDPREAAQQMRAAYDMIIGQGWKHVAHPLQAPFVMPTHLRRQGHDGH